MASSYPRLASQLDAEAAALRAEANPSENLKTVGGGGTSGGMDGLVDAKIEAAEARTDAKFAQVLAKFDSLTTEMRSIRNSIWTAAFAVMGLILAIVTLLVTVAPSAFAIGAQMREVARNEARMAAIPAPAAPTTGAKIPAKPAN